MASYQHESPSAHLVSPRPSPSPPCKFRKFHLGFARAATSTWPNGNNPVFTVQIPSPSPRRMSTFPFRTTAPQTTFVP
ncbi:hypothetical protein E4U53_004645, partial [Claviceps sorghi]